VISLLKNYQSVSRNTSCYVRYVIYVLRVVDYQFSVTFANYAAHRILLYHLLRGSNRLLFMLHLPQRFSTHYVTSQNKIFSRRFRPKSESYFCVIYAHSEQTQLLYFAFYLICWICCFSFLSISVLLSLLL